MGRKGCSRPGCDEPAPMLCTRCRGARYCSAECQKGHWKEHKRECAKGAGGADAKAGGAGSSVPAPAPPGPTKLTLSAADLASVDDALAVVTGLAAKVGGGGGGDVAPGSSVTAIAAAFRSFTDKHVEPLGALLERLPRVAVLDISCNAFANAAVLRRIATTTVHTVDLGVNPLGDDGAIDVAEVLESNPPSLTDLDMHACQIGDPGAEALIASLKKNSVLRALNLRANSMTDDLLPWVSGAVKANTSLTSINLKSNDFSPMGERELAHLLAGSGTITDHGAATPSLQALCCVQ